MLERQKREMLEEGCGDMEGCLSPWVPLAEESVRICCLPGGAESTVGNKACLLWDYSQDKALTGCAIVSTVKGKKITSKHRKKKERKETPQEDKRQH